MGRGEAPISPPPRPPGIPRAHSQLSAQGLHGFGGIAGLGATGCACVKTGPFGNTEKACQALSMDKAADQSVCGH